jgi:phosphoglucosamine mutase
VGDRYVLEELLRSGAILGGEQSGHVIFLDHATTGDGLLTAVRFLSLARRERATVADLAGQMRRYPQVLVSVRVADTAELDTAEEIWEAVRDAEDALGESGRVLVRASGTEAVVRVMVEAETEEDARRYTDSLAETVVRACSRGSAMRTPSSEPTE